jgi:DNA-binding transcriptional MerR regulator
MLMIDAATEFTIGTLARQFGVTLRTLRFYEDKGLLNPRRKDTTRYYSARDRDQLSVILKAKQLGFTLTEIKAMMQQDGSPASVTIELSPETREEQIAHLEKQKFEIEAALQDLYAMRLRAA